ncbi:hypothetical protein E2C01_044257 [Portunus trituberculatus]|uniref:Uncharacterized protein n=1 Tax=Portunus trituberculatus TaxID=210409 RepID=A0A5B7FZX7_PORTR|nr:hypothetical protein [Portunus trituberculatus]
MVGSGPADTPHRQSIRATSITVFMHWEEFFGKRRARQSNACSPPPLCREAMNLALEMAREQINPLSKHNGLMPLHSLERSKFLYTEVAVIPSHSSSPGRYLYINPTPVIYPTRSTNRHNSTIFPCILYWRPSARHAMIRTMIHKHIHHLPLTTRPADTFSNPV